MSKLSIADNYARNTSTTYEGLKKSFIEAMSIRDEEIINRIISKINEKMVVSNIVDMQKKANLISSIRTLKDEIDN